MKPLEDAMKTFKTSGRFIENVGRCHEKTLEDATKTLKNAM
jgi:hypothetical protein